MSAKRATFVCLVMGTIGIAISFALYVHQTDSTASPPPTYQHDGSQSTPAPSVNKPSPQTIAAYTVADDLPKYLHIPDLNIDTARIMHLGTNTNRQIIGPDNVHDTAWYTGSSKPGQPGTTFISGHVSSWEAKGIFKDLHTLKKGDRIAITKGDNTRVVYSVTHLRTYAADKVPMSTILAPQKPGIPSLALMTCTGKIIKGTSDFSERLVVYAVATKP